MDIKSVSASAVSRTPMQMEHKMVDTTIVPKQVQEAAAPSPNPVVSSETLKDMTQAIEKVNQQLVQSGQNIMFSVDQNTQSSVVKVVDRGTEEVIKQFPSESSLEMIANIQRYLESVQNGQRDNLTGSLLNEII